MFISDWITRKTRAWLNHDPWFPPWCQKKVIWPISFQLCCRNFFEPNPPPSTKGEWGGSWCQRSDLTNFVAISDNSWKKIFYSQIFWPPTIGMMTGVMGVTGETRVTGAVQRRRRKRRSRRRRCNHGGTTNKQRTTRKDRATQPILEGWDEQFELSTGAQSETLKKTQNVNDWTVLDPKIPAPSSTKTIIAKGL